MIPQKWRRLRMILRECYYRLITAFPSDKRVEITLPFEEAIVTRPAHDDNFFIEIKIDEKNFAIMVSTGDAGEWLIHSKTELSSPWWVWLRRNLPSARFYTYRTHLVMLLNDADHTRMLFTAS